MDEILESHNIYPLAARLDEFEEFFGMRKTILLRRIEAAMGKPVLALTSPQEVFNEDPEDTSGEE